MFSRADWNVIRRTFPIVESDGRRLKWWFRDEQVSQTRQVFLDAILNPKAVSPDWRMHAHRRTERKVVLRIEAVNGGTNFFCKGFLLNTFSRRLRAFRCGLDEAANFIRARQHGIAAPRVLGYGQMRDDLGLVRMNMVILEDLEYCVTISQLMQSAAEYDRAALFHKTTSLFADLYHAGCNHIDINSRAIMLNPKDADSRLLDR